MSRANAIHRRCINFKVQQAGICYRPTANGMPLRDFLRCNRDFHVFGYFFFRVIRGILGNVLGYSHIPALNMRVKPRGRYCRLLNGTLDRIDFERGEVFMGMQYDSGQDVYGVPDWIGGLHDVFLNSEGTLFRRRYYKNGSHMGYILYTTDSNLDKDLEKKIEAAVRGSKGPGNFRSMYMNIPGGDKDAVKLIPVGDIGQKDDFNQIKTVSKQDILIAHGMQPALAGMAPENTGGFGDIDKIQLFYRQNEVRAQVQPFVELNDQLGQPVFQFDFNAGIDTI
ncbi:phage portal protein [Oceanobacter sp. 4_MG-2023]|uniref:phage portal protein n=1 Tax=Oceanobacter sp. 4_MG-2023 TaxID=3062623 RepID=UPI002736AD42|nr:phage portal protein [Oceanobacter sp. 4_MG-2023]MDP2548887.1 phage portal protein [Oceanobacter sp. 4_MG-2023]